MLSFEWDEEKNRVNFAKHGIWFEEAQSVWADAASQEYFDSEHSAREDRFLRVGHSGKARILLIVFCERLDGSVIRIISARKAALKEEKEYEKGI